MGGAQSSILFFGLSIIYRPSIWGHTSFIQTPISQSSHNIARSQCPASVGRCAPHQWSLERNLVISLKANKKTNSLPAGFSLVARYTCPCCSCKKVACIIAHKCDNNLYLDHPTEWLVNDHYVYSIYLYIYISHDIQYIKYIYMAHLLTITHTSWPRR